MCWNKNTMYQEKISGKRKIFLVCGHLLFSSGLQPCFPRAKKNTFYYTYKNTSIISIYVYLYINVYLMYFFSWKCIHLYIYVHAHKHRHHSRCMHLNIHDSKLDLKTSLDKVQDQLYIFQFHFFLRESKHMISSPTSSASRSYRINSDNLTWI